MRYRLFSRFFLILENLIGRCLIVGVGLIVVLKSSGSPPPQSPLYLYHLTNDGLRSVLENNGFEEAADLDFLKQFLIERHQLQTLSDEEIKGIITDEDFRHYQQKILNDHGSVAGNPNCGCL